MALIFCEECGAQISDRATVCPQCGCPVSKKKTCPDCGTIVEEEAKVCPECGCPFENAPAESAPVPMALSAQSTPNAGVQQQQNVQVVVEEKKGGPGMGCGRVFLALIFPPLAVIDQGCGSILIVTFCTLFFWLPGFIAALIILDRK